MRAKLHLVVGGQSSGKSEWAEDTVLTTTPEWISPVILCPCEPFDQAMKDRIARHQAVRDDRWTTVEGFNLLELIANVPTDTPILIDAIDTWVSQRAWELGIDQPKRSDVALLMGRLIEEATAIGRAIKQRVAQTLIIAGVPGLGMVPLGEETRRLVDLHGKITQALEPDQVTWIHAGRVIAQG